MTIRHWESNSAIIFTDYSNIDSDIEKVDGSQVFFIGATKEQVAQFMSRTNSVLEKDFGITSRTAKQIRSWAGSAIEGAGRGGSRPGAGNPNFIPKD